MKKVFLAVLAAGLFFACSNDTKDKAVEEPVAEEVEATVDEPAQEATVETIAPVTEEKKEGVKVSGDKNEGVKVETENTNVTADKDGNVELKINTKGKNSKGNR